MSETATLSDAVSSIEETADRKTNLETVDEKVSTAERRVKRLSSDLDDLADAIEELQFYRRILADAFDGDVPAAVHSALEDAENAAATDRDALVEQLRDESTTALQADIEDATDSVEHATRRVKKRLNDQYWSKWDERISSAKELQEIIGVHNAEFANTIKETERYIKKHMRDPEENAANVVSGWRKVTEQWEQHQDLQGLSAFQETHGLSDEAVSVVQQLSQDSVTLAEVEINVIQELKDIPDLEAAVTLEL